MTRAKDYREAEAAGGGSKSAQQRGMIAVLVLLLAIALGASSATAETVDVKYRGPVDLAPFKCESITRSSFIQRVCYDAPNKYMLISLSGTFYHYCGIDAGTVASLKGADSMGWHFNANVKGSFDCRTGKVPTYR